MRSGPRVYTERQARFIQRAVKQRQPLPYPALPLQEEEE